MVVWWPLLLVGYTEQVGVEVVEISGDVAAGVAAPGVRLRVEAPVEEVEGLVGVDNVAVGAGVPGPAAGVGPQSGGV